MPSLILHPPAALLSLCLGLNPQLGAPQLSPGWGPGATASCVCLLSPCAQNRWSPCWSWGRTEASPPGCPQAPALSSTS